MLQHSNQNMEMDQDTLNFDPYSQPTAEDYPAEDYSSDSSDD